MKIYTDIIDLKFAAQQRRKLYSTIPMFALGEVEILVNTSNMNNNLLIEKIIQYPIFSTMQHINSSVTILCHGENQTLSFPLNSGLDCKVEPLPLVDGEHVQAVCKIVYGTMNDHAKFWFVNSVGMTVLDGRVVFDVLCQRQSVDQNMIQRAIV